MTLYRTLYQIALALQTETDSERLPAFLLEKVIEFTGAQKGFIVVREDGSFKEKYQVHFDTGSHNKLFSSSMVRKVIRSRRLYISDNISEDREFQQIKSVRSLGACSVLVAPLAYAGEVNSVVYLEKDIKSGPFEQDVIPFVEQFSVLAGTCIHKALEHQQLQAFRDKWHARGLPEGDFTGIVGNHPNMQKLFRQLLPVAKTDGTVLIRGETGAGKEMIAKAIVANSPRKDKPYAALHCGALPETLFESELFGHMRGSFTGANQNRVGRVGAVAGGTLFFDEVAEIPLTSQAKLLRFFQFGEYQRIGSDRVEKVDVRIVAATHRNLEEMVKEGTFREDLYYRLKVLELEIPPLRRRRSDIPLLVDHFLDQFSRKNQSVPRLSDEALRALQAYDFPGNVRELSHALERAHVLAAGGLVELEDLPREIGEHYYAEGGKQGTTADEIVFSQFTKEVLGEVRNRETTRATERVEKAFLKGLMSQAGQSVAEAARLAGMGRSYLHRMISKYKD